MLRIPSKTPSWDRYVDGGGECGVAVFAGESTGAASGVFLRMQLNTQDFDKTLEFPHKSRKNLANTSEFWQNEYIS
jgi:hypothetical protein